jgi:enoyl-CoA hydratase
MSEDHGKVSCEQKDHVFLIGLDRISKRNAFDSHLIAALSQALTDYENDPELRCAVIFAYGDHFTAGLDLPELYPKMSNGIFSQDNQQINPWGTTGRTRKKPVIIAVKGYCYTAGIELILNADICIAHHQTQFTQLEVQRGILPFGGATSRFVKAAGWSNAMRYLLTGDFFDAETAHRLNIITEITQSDPLERALELAQTISQAAPLAVQATITSAKESIELSESEAFLKLNDHLKTLLATKDIQEGVQAMMEKRIPQFKGQ